MMKKLLFSLLALPALMGMTSCDDGKVANYQSFVYENNLTYSIDTENNTQYVGAPVDYNCKFDYDNGTFDLKGSGLVLAQGLSPISIAVEGVKYRFTDNGGINVTVPSVISVYGGQSHEITNFSFTRWSRQITYAGLQIDNIALSFVVDGRYVVRAVQAVGALVGRTQVADVQESPKPVEQTQPFVIYTLDYSSKKAVVSYNFLTLGGYKYTTIQMKDIPFDLTPQGVQFPFLLQFDAQVVNQPNVEMKLRGLDISLNYVPEMTVSFTANDRYAVTGTYNATGL